MKNTAVRNSLLFFCVIYFVIQPVYAQNEDLDKSKKDQRSSALISAYEKAGLEVYHLKDLDVSPKYPGCDENSGEITDSESCSFQKFLMNFYKSLNYPAQARKKGTEGTVYASFLIDKDGNIADIKILEDIGNGCGKAVEEVLKQEQEKTEPWIPGKVDDKPVNVLYILPVKFKLG